MKGTWISLLILVIQTTHHNTCIITLHLQLRSLYSAVCKMRACLTKSITDHQSTQNSMFGSTTAFKKQSQTLKKHKILSKLLQFALIRKWFCRYAFDTQLTAYLFLHGTTIILTLSWSFCFVFEALTLPIFDSLVKPVNPRVEEYNIYIRCV